MNDRSALSYLYLAPGDVLIPRVDRQCIMRFCEALSARGLEIELVSLNVRLDYDEPTRSRSLFEVYGVDTPFRIKILPSGARQSRSEGVRPLWRLIAYTAFVARKLLMKRNAAKVGHTVIYFKNYLLAIPLLIVRDAFRSRVMLLFEAHVPPATRLQRAVLKRVDGVVAISGTLSRCLQDELGLSPDRLLVAHQGVNLKMIEGVRLGKVEARRKVELPPEDRLVVYTGKVNDSSREVDLLLTCARYLREDAQVVIVGGREDHVARLRERTRRQGIENVRFVGFVPPSEVFRYQMAADVLVSYYPTGSPLNPYRSPGKLFEYMASRRPIVTADYPSLREVLRPGSAVFVESDDPEKLSRAILRVLEDDGFAASLAAQAHEDVRPYTWEARADRVHGFALRLLESRRPVEEAAVSGKAASPSEAADSRKKLPPDIVRRA